MTHPGILKIISDNIQVTVDQPMNSTCVLIGAAVHCVMRGGACRPAAAAAPVGLRGDRQPGPGLVLLRLELLGVTTASVVGLGLGLTTGHTERRGGFHFLFWGFSHLGTPQK